MCCVPGGILVVVQFPRLLIRVIDPATAYAGERRRHPGPIYRGGAVWGSGVPGGSRQATPEEIDEIRQQVSHLRRGAEPAIARPLDSQALGALSRAARDLVTAGHATIEMSQRVCYARVVKFWRGDSVLEVTEESGPVLSRTRIPRTLGAQHENLLSTYLASCLGHT
jgi:hypothetical protein